MVSVAGLVDSCRICRFSLVDFSVDFDADFSFFRAVGAGVGGGALPSFGLVVSCRSGLVSVGLGNIGFFRINLDACSCLATPFLFFKWKFFRCSLLGVSNPSWEIFNFLSFSRVLISCRGLYLGGNRGFGFPCSFL